MVLDHDYTQWNVRQIENLRTVLHNKLALLQLTRQKTAFVPGRVINRLTGQKAGYVERNGIELLGLRRLINEKADIELMASARAIYWVPYDEAQRMLEALKALVEAKHIDSDSGT